MWLCFCFDSFCCCLLITVDVVGDLYKMAHAARGSNNDLQQHARVYLSQLQLFYSFQLHLICIHFKHLIAVLPGSLCNFLYSNTLQASNNQGDLDHGTALISLLDHTTHLELVLFLAGR